MMSADEFKRRIQNATKKGLFSGQYKLGRTATIALALEAYEDSVSKGEAQAEQAAYCYQIIKNCDTWLRLKNDKILEDKRNSNTKARKGIIVTVRNEAAYTLQQYPLIVRALDKYARRKGAGQKGQATPLFRAYAHEGTAYRELKAQGQFVDPGMPRYTPSSTLIAEKGATAATTQRTRLANGTPYKDLDFNEFLELDRLLGSQYKVLYMSKLQRLEYMVVAENGTFSKATDGSVFTTSNRSVNDDLGQGPQKNRTQLYACDKYGSLFIVGGDLVDRKTNQPVQVNHSTLLAGREVLCAGTISIKNGVLKGITNLSGHYQPNTAALTLVLRELRDTEGVSMKNVIVMDLSQGITTTAVSFLDGDYTDQRENRLVKRVLEHG